MKKPITVYIDKKVDCELVVILNAMNEAAMENNLEKMSKSNLIQTLIETFINEMKDYGNKE